MERVVNKKRAVLLPTSFFVWVMLLIVAVDFFSKEWATVQGMVTINTGVSFGLGKTLSPEMMMALVIGWWVILSVVSIWCWDRWSNTKRLAISLMIGSGIANLLDRWLTSGVRDWLPLGIAHLRNNIADWAIAVGLFVWIAYETYELMVYSEQEKKHA